MTKIDIISGFLGAGKTTFIKKLLQEAISGEQVVLIENEFGEIGIDGGFLKDFGIEIREMNSGCICCSLVGDFGKSLSEVLTKYKPDRIIIEPSGVGKLSDVTPFYFVSFLNAPLLYKKRFFPAIISGDNFAIQSYTFVRFKMTGLICFFMAYICHMVHIPFESILLWFPHRSLYFFPSYL